MRRVALRAVMVLLLPLGVVLMHQVPLPALLGSPAAPASQHAGAATSAVPHPTGGPRAEAVGGSAHHRTGALPAAHPAGAHQDAGHRDTAGQKTGHPAAADRTTAPPAAEHRATDPAGTTAHRQAGCGWLLHLCLAVLTAVLGAFALRRFGVRVVPPRGPPAARSPRVPRRPRPPPHPYVLCVLRL
ncbi:hypothetical protein GCM10027174_41410 [Salinifilum aidingensis]